MRYLSLPIDCNISELDPNDNAIDMAQLNFPGVEKDAVPRAALLYIRNTGVTLPLTFENCSYDDKEKFLLLYMKSNISVDVPILSCTWLSILLYMRHMDSGLPNILNPDEVHTFVGNNTELIKNMLRLALSLPVEAMVYATNERNLLSELGDDPFEIDEYPKSDYNEINFANFVNMTDYAIFIELIEDDMDGIKPTYFLKYFSDISGPIEWKLHNNLPFLSILKLALDSDRKSKFIEGLGNILTNWEEEHNNA